VSPPVEWSVVNVVGHAAALTADVRAGLGRRPYHLPPKYFYDDVGSKLFDAICDTPEYYLTRSETALLEQTARAIVRETDADEIVEFGSGTSRKTRLLLDALVAHSSRPHYAMLDVSETTLRATAALLTDAYPTLSIHAIAVDYDREMPEFPPSQRRLVAFLGSSIGNYGPGAARRFFRSIAAHVGPSDRLLLGVDLVKSADVLCRAYDDARGITAEFNRNVLRVINRTLGADFDVGSFQHVARYNAELEQMEMFLRSQRAQEVHVPSLGLTVPFEAGELLHTEISRKFTRDSTQSMLRDGGFLLERWNVSPDGAFAHAIARAESST